MLLALVIAAVGAAELAGAQWREELPPELEQRAQRLHSSLMCLQCAGQSIDQSNAPLAKTMRQTIREQLIGGASDDEIIELMVSAYGEGVLASPPARGFSLAAWAVPPIAILLGAGAVAIAVRSLRRNSAAGGQFGAAAAGAGASGAGTGGSAAGGGAGGGELGLEPYLDIVDRELAGEAGSGSVGVDG